MPFPKLEDPRGRRIDHGVILRVVSTNICGSGVEVITLDDAPRGCAAFDAGAPRKYVIDPHGLLAKAA